MSIVAKGQITITDLNDGINGDNGKTYILNILNGVRSITYNANGASPSPAQTAFSCELYEDGTLVKPTSYAWTASGVLSGTSSSATFTPTCATSFSNANNAVSLTVKYNNQTIRNTVPISATRVGANGTNGTNALLAVLSNETHTIPTDTSGNNGNYTGATTTMYIYNGATDDSANWTVSATASNVTGSLSGKTYTVTLMSADIGYVDLTASRSGYTSITKRFTLTKSKQGTAGSNGSAGQHATAYKLISNVAAIGKNLSNVYIPATITISATSATGTAAPKAYAGRFVIAETTNGTSYTTKYTSSANESSKIYTPSAGIKAINAKLYLAGGTATLLDEQTIPIVSDGATGPQGVPGVQGPAGADGKTYYTWIKYADDASGNGMSDYPDGKKYIGMAYNKTTSVESTTASDYAWALIQGPQGATGANGKTYYTWLKYADTPTSGMSDSPDGKKYMGLAYNKTTATESTNYSDYTWSLIKGSDGANGTDGKDGIGVKSTAITYQASTSGTTPPTGTWLSTIPTVSAGQYLWTKTLITYTDNSTSTSYSVGKMGEQGKQGNAGKGIASTTTEYQASTSGTTPPTSTWSTSIPSVSAGQFLWTRITIKYTDGSTPSVSYSVSKMGDTGKGISQVKNYYLATSASSGVTTSTSGWTESVQTMTATNKYLWNYERIVYTSGPDTLTAPTIIGTYAKDGNPGKGIVSIVEYYLVSSSSSGVTTFTSGWSTTIPTMTTTNKYLWNYEVINYTAGSPTTSTPKIIGVHGATGPQGPQGSTGPQGATGVGVQSTAVSYQASTSGTTPPTGSWSSGVPSVAAGQYLWTRTLITYTDGKSSTSYSVGKMGEQGKQGNTGRGISSTVTEYQVSTSGTTPPTGTWSTSVPSVAAGQYLWTRITIKYTDGSTPSVSYAVGKMGAQGPQGPQGSTGPQGVAGRSVVSITELYKKLNTKAQQATPTSDTGWSTTPPTWSSGYYLHMCTKITYDKGTPLVEYTKPFCDNSWEAVNEVNTQENIFNTLTNNGQTQGLYMQDKKLYLNGEYLKAGTVAADKLIIGIGDGGGLCKNPAFKNWTSTYPDGTSAWSSGGISKQVVDGRNVAQFTCSTSGTQYGMTLSSSFFANNINLDGVEYIALEVKFRLTSGTNPSGAAFLVDIYATDGTYHRLQLNMSEVGSTLTTNTWYTAKKVFQVPATSLAKTFKSCSGYLLANWSGSGNAIKTIQFATANAYMASKQDFLTQSWANGTEINGAKITTGSLSASQITTGILKAKVGSSSLNLNDGTMLLGSTSNANYLQWTGSALNIGGTINATAGKVATFTISGANLIGANVGMSGTNGTNMAFWAGSNTASSAPFRVSHAGALTCSNATITGGSLKIGSKFQVASDGTLTASNGNFTGTITGSSITSTKTKADGRTYTLTYNEGGISGTVKMGNETSNSCELSPNILELYRFTGTNTIKTTLEPGSFSIYAAGYPIKIDAGGTQFNFPVQINTTLGVKEPITIGTQALIKGNLIPGSDRLYDLGEGNPGDEGVGRALRPGYRWKGIYGMWVNADDRLTVSTDSANHTGWDMYGEYKADGTIVSRLVAIHNDNEWGCIEFVHNHTYFGFSGSLFPSDSTGEHYSLGHETSRWRGARFKYDIQGFDGNSGYYICHYLGSGNATAAWNSVDASGQVSAQVLLYNEYGNKYFQPGTNNDVGLGRSGAAYRDIWAYYGLVQTCDMNAKENIALISNRDAVTYTSENSSITEQDIYDFIKNVNVYSYNYKSFAKADTEAITEVKVIEEPAKQIGMLAQELKETNSKIWEYIGVNEDNTQEESMAAIKQGSMTGLLLSGLKTAIDKIEASDTIIEKCLNKIEALEKQIEDLQKN